jgi:phosphoribosyl 1,2-cyclic phosphate phosphodiesterase
MHDTMKVYGFRIGDFAYLTDVNSISEDTMKKMKGLKVLVISALRKSEHPSHFTLDEVIDVVQILKPETTYLTHMSHLIGLHSDLENELPEGIHPAHDGLTLVSI